MQPSKLCLFSNDTINSNMRPPCITQCIVVCVTESIYRIKTLTKQKENAEERARLADEMVHTNSQTYKVNR